MALTYRPQEIAFVLDAAENVGLAGHTLGAFYALLMGAGMAVNCDVQNPVLTEVSFCAWPEARGVEQSHGSARREGLSGDCTRAVVVHCFVRDRARRAGGPYTVDDPDGERPAV